MALSVPDLITCYDLPPSPYFHQKSYLQSDFSEGVVTTKNGRRIVILPQELILGIHEAIEYETGRAWNLIAYLCGCRWGERLLHSVRSEWRHFHHSSIDHVDFEVFQIWLTEYFAFHGWGGLELDFSMEEEGLVQIWLSNSILDRLLTDLSGGYVNEIFCGLLASWCSWFASAELECVEIASPQLGADRARLVLGLRPRIEAVRRVRATGGDTSDMLEALSNFEP